MAEYIAPIQRLIEEFKDFLASALKLQQDLLFQFWDLRMKRLLALRTLLTV
jgi:hypothetical protein